MPSQSIRDTQPMKSDSSIGASSIFARMDETDSDVPNTASHTPATASSQSSFHQTGTGVSSTSIQFFSPSPTDGLDGYQSLALRARAPGASPSLRCGRSFKASDVLSSGIFQSNKKQIRLPIGECPCSIFVSQIPITPALIASSTVQCLLALSQFPLVPTSAVPASHIEMPLTAFAELDSLDTSPLSGTGIFAQRQRAERALDIPGSVTVSQEYDLLDYAIAGAQVAKFIDFPLLELFHWGTDLPRDSKYFYSIILPQLPLSHNGTPASWTPSGA
ncbi:hypothetical protein DEU56DRAFT_956547 [Suillus clintonianus]|uniref:uncharacterized protein n=1 Tax=Suillus clintonianus TaxID=1904413 RepID=UPI001B8750E8|nr:uncharacterized protein DEU56DRAFT_956547 [Suillus clintonianus]KAG2129629.1 hypothetical protein DEU56DRAFT_956547 [Suillus clintonianus]